MKRTKFPVAKETIAKIKAMESTLKDDDIMPFGQYHESGTKMANVPSWYLLNLYYSGKCFGAIKNYIQDNLEVLEMEKSRMSAANNSNNWIHDKN
jgi:uncharacterized protein (DUF3820 family)